MERRNFLRLLVGGASVAVAPSLVWPFRKIFLPPVKSMVSALAAEFEATMRMFGRNLDAQLFADGGATITEMAVEAIELEAFAKNIPDLIYNGKTLYNFFQKEPVGLFAGAEVTYLSAMKTLPPSLRGKELRRSFGNFIRGIDAQKKMAPGWFLE